MQSVRKFNAFLCKFENLINSVLLCTVLIVITAQIVMRYVFNRPLLWSEELSRYMYVWIAWAGCAFCVGTRSHICVPVIFDRFSARWKMILSVVGNLVVLAAMCYLIPVSVQYAVGQKAFKASTLPISRIWLYIALPSGFLLSAIQLVLDTLIMIDENVEHKERR